MPAASRPWPASFQRRPSWPPVDAEELVCLDRLVRTLHGLNLGVMAEDSQLQALDRTSFGAAIDFLQIEEPRRRLPGVAFGRPESSPVSVRPGGENVGLHWARKQCWAIWPPNRGSRYETRLRNDGSNERNQTLGSA
ncbi:MAG: hypothetical protein H6R10_3343 [Rhodocyclaceae bacterium]|nr:hypothetical protein [Rhodocyclaceae bacterium]